MNRTAFTNKATDGVPQEVHFSQCIGNIRELKENPSLCFHLCPERKISFDGFLNDEGRRFGVPYTYRGATARIMRDGDTIYIYSADMSIS